MSLPTLCGCKDCNAVPWKAKYLLFPRQDMAGNWWWGDVYRRAVRWDTLDTWAGLMCKIQVVDWEYASRG